jgi:hypothetical protein
MQIFYGILIANDVVNEARKAIAIRQSAFSHFVFVG